MKGGEGNPNPNPNLGCVPCLVCLYIRPAVCIVTVSRTIFVSRYQNVSILDFVGAKDDDLAEHCHCGSDLYLYADDAKLFSFIKCWEDSLMLQKDLDNLTQWMDN